MRRQEFAERAKHFSKALRSASKGLSRKEQQWLTDVVFILSSYACVRAFRDYLDLDTEEAGKRVSWAIRLLTRGAMSSGDASSSDEAGA
jgi:hypothetical protein